MLVTLNGIWHLGERSGDDLCTLCSDDRTSLLNVVWVYGRVPSGRVYCERLNVRLGLGNQEPLEKAEVEVKAAVACQSATVIRRCGPVGKGLLMSHSAPAGYRVPSLVGVTRSRHVYN